MPETQEKIEFDDLGICLACQSSEDKMHINWKEKDKELRKILNDVKKKSGNNYDCILPISGGKDSFFQAHLLTQVYNVKPLAVTFSHNWFTKTGIHNLNLCLETFNLDHIQFTPARNLVNKMAKMSLKKIGDACWHCHTGIGVFPIQIAIKFNIPFIVYGESSAEHSGRDKYGTQKNKYNQDYFLKQSAKIKPDDVISDELTKKDLHPLQMPSAKEFKKAKVKGIFLGDYVFWDEEKQVEFVKKEYGWKETDMEGTYKKYKSVECIMSGVHDFSCYLKRGFGRASFQASTDIRKGILTRDEAKKLVAQYDAERPYVLDYFLKITGYTEEEYYKILEEQKHEKIKNIKLKIKNKNRSHSEKLEPYPIQIIKEK
jgi:N-acetyl sugar amidotransferase